MEQIEHLLLLLININKNKNLLTLHPPPFVALYKFKIWNNLEQMEQILSVVRPHVARYLFYPKS
jgi:hypothetical protein